MKVRELNDYLKTEEAKKELLDKPKEKNKPVLRTNRCKVCDRLFKTKYSSRKKKVCPDCKSKWAKDREWKIVRSN